MFFNYYYYYIMYIIYYTVVKTPSTWKHNYIIINSQWKSLRLLYCAINNNSVVMIRQ